ncbi:disco-interacting protein 2 homolog C-like isoform X2 [Macaca nemestrina]|uniref:disco-interacting protein 2 homolog C-like isoform X2 n=1 Tax=Macaca nemestrina TaxID=9545 RepID=UPI0039B92C81
MCTLQTSACWCLGEIDTRIAPMPANLKQEFLCMKWVTKMGDVHTEAVQAALARHKERKMAVPVPSKRRSLVVQTSMDAYTPPDTSSGSEDEGSVQGDSQGTPTSSQGCITMEHWISQAIHGSTTSITSSTSSSSMQSGGSRAAHRLAEVMTQTHIENHSAPPDVTTYTSEHSIQMQRPQGSTGSRTAPEYGNAELMETSGGPRMTVTSPRAGASSPCMG